MSILAATVWFGGEGLKGTLGGSSCRWCESNAVDEGVRDALKWDDIQAADTWSNVTGFAVAPVADFGGLALVELGDGSPRGGAIDRFPADALMVVEAAAFAGAANEIVKISAGRERPFVHALPAEWKLRTRDPGDNNMSFYSGHTSFTFALAAASGTVASLRGYRWAPALWAGGLTVAGLTGYLRIAADRHWLTDVVTGAVAGTAIGVAVPLLLHGRQPSPASASSASSTAPLFALTFAL